MVINANLVITFASLHGAIVPALESVDIELIGKYVHKARDYMLAYIKGNKPGNELQKKVVLQVSPSFLSN